MNTSRSASQSGIFTPRILSAVALCFVSVLLAIFSLAGPPPAAETLRANTALPDDPQTTAADQKQLANEPPDVAAFRQSVGGSITPLIIELKGEPGVIRKVNAEQQGQSVAMEETFAYAQQLVGEQELFRVSLGQRGVRALLRETDVQQIDGSVRHIQYRFTYLLNGFVAYVATEDVARLRALSDVALASEIEPVEYHLDRAIDYSLGTQSQISDRRLAVYGAKQEFSPGGNQNCNPVIDPTCHPEEPLATTVDGFEGRNMNIAVIDSGVDWRHPMFGGIGQQTPRPHVSGQPVNPADNKKVVYYYALSSPGDPTDDFGHGTLVSSCAAGYSVDANTPVRLLFGTGNPPTSFGVGPPPNGAQLFGSAPQARIMAYKVCGPANRCDGDIPLALEDAASPFTLVSSGNSGPTPVAKPVADVINLSLGSTLGDPAAPNSRAANNAALAGTIVVTSAGNSGPGLGTVGNPGVATLAIAVAASLDPGSLPGADVLAPNQIPLETRAPAPGPSPEMGRSSNLNATQPGERQGMRIFPVTGGGPLPNERNPGEPALNTGSVSAHYVFVERRNTPGTPPTPPPPVPVSVTNRIAVVKFEGPFAAPANAVAPLNPAAIVLISDTQNASAVQVISGIPTFTVSVADGEYLLDLLASDDNNADDPANGAISELPLRLADTISLPAFQGAIAGFSSRGPNDHLNANYRILKPDVAAPGVGIVGAATVEGLPDDTIGLASTTGYTSANGTSFSSPITAGMMAVIRQRVREQLNLDSTNPSDRARRFDTVTVARALLQNSATNLRNGEGQPQGNGASSAGSINAMGSGHINIAGALTANAIMVAPSTLFALPAEYSPGALELTVLLPTVSYGAVPVVRLNDTIVRTREVIIRDVTGNGGGTYNLTVQNNRNADAPGFGLIFTATADSETPITSIEVPANGQASFFMRAAADGAQITADPTEFQWYATATQGSTGKTLRMPFYFRAVTAVVPNSKAPVQQAPAGIENPSSPNCPTDTDGSFTVKWTYSTPSHLGFRVQEGTQSTSIFFDNADEPLQPNVVGTTAVSENSKWRDSGLAGTPPMPPQWESATNPDTNSPAYFIPAGTLQNHSLTLKNAIVLPSTGITLSFRTNGRIDTNFDYSYVEISTDNASWSTVLSLTGIFTGTREVDLSPYAGQTVRLRFRMFSPQGVSSAAGAYWFVEDIRITSDDFRTIANTAAADRSLPIASLPNGTYFYRIAALYSNLNPLDPGTVVTGPYSNVLCVNVSGPFEGVVSRKTHGGSGNTFDVSLPLVAPAGIECRKGGGANADTHQVVFQFAQPVSYSGASATPAAGKTAEVDSVMSNGNEVAVNLKNVSNAQTISVTLLNVNSGNGPVNLTVPMSVLLGDVDASGRTDSGDVTLVRQKTVSLPDASTFRNDVNTSGRIDAGDVTVTRNNSVTVLPPP